MQAIQVRAPGAPFELVERPVPEPLADEVLLRVEACGVCHGDSIASEGRFPGLTHPRVPGHEVVGTIEHVGSPSLAARWKVGQRVGVGWHGGHCFHCAACRRGEFGACESSLTTGLSSDGGYAQFMIARAEVLVPIPEELTSVEAAPLLCAGRTTFGALRSSEARGGDLVAIHGLGGLGHLAVQFASKLGFRTVALSRGAHKQALAMKLGAHHYIDTEAGDPAAALSRLGGARVILCTAPSGSTIGQLVNGLDRNGQLMIVTFAREPIPLSPVAILRGSRSITGWVGGAPEDALAFAVLTGVRPMIETFPLAQAATAFERMMTAKVRFRGVLTMEKTS